MSRYICMNTQFYPKKTEESYHEFFDVGCFPADVYPLKKITDWFYAVFIARLKTLDRQARYISIYKDEIIEGSPTILRVVANLGGNERVEALLYEEYNFADMKPGWEDDIVNVLIDGIPEYRGLDTLEEPGCWDIIYHGDQYPSKQEDYETKITNFFKGVYANENSETETRL